VGATDPMSKATRFYEAPVAGALRSAPAALRNREPIAQVLAEWLPQSGLVLEVASGTGEHAIYFAERFPALEWQPSDIHPDALESIRAWRGSARLPNVREPVELDAAASDWPVGRADAVLSINMVHISPWASALGLIAGAAGVLPPNGPLILYGPWLKDDIPTAPSNLASDSDLRARNPEWGLRRVEDFADPAAGAGLQLEGTRAMPANNLMLLFRRSGQGVK
jgi:SAM-dependent methyltransferase